jgi:hypothetical protein
MGDGKKSGGETDSGVFYHTVSGDKKQLIYLDVTG